MKYGLYRAHFERTMISRYPHHLLLTMISLVTVVVIFSMIIVVSECKLDSANRVCDH